MEKEYKNDRIVVKWEPEKCIHSTKCWKGLLPVFDPRRKPWVDLSAAETEEIIAQIDKCPSGALSWKFIHGDNKESSTSGETIVEAMKNGPLILYGNVQVKNSEGKIEMRNKSTAFCRCGASSNKPYCDGSHVKIGFQG